MNDQAGRKPSRQPSQQAREQLDGQSDEQAGDWEQFPSFPDDQGLSLEELSQAYAQLISQGDDPYQVAPEKPTIPGDSLPESEDESWQGDQGEAEEPVELEGVQDDDPCAISPRSIFEAMLFVGHPDNVPLESQQVASLMRGVRVAEVDEMVRELNELYDVQQCPYRIRSVGAGYRLELREEFHPLRDKFYGRVKAAKLSQACVDTLAIVAYNQPITREQVERFRARPSGAVLAQLVRRQLLRIDRTTEEGKKVSRYVTTDRFLQVFGLESLDELPQGQDPED
jgi:segregation and condensation protein B